MFVQVHGDPYALIQADSADHTRNGSGPAGGAGRDLKDIRAEVLTPNRLNTVVFGLFAARALAIALVDVAGVLAFSVCGRIRGFGIRLAVGSALRQLVTDVISPGRDD
jgi:hypothetical protein